MYDKSRRKHLTQPTVGELKQHLEGLPDDTLVYICGDNEVFLHFEENNSEINLDTEDLDESEAYMTEEEKTAFINKQ